MNYKEVKIVFMGTPEISAYLLEHLLMDGYQIVAVIAQPDKPVGRKKIIQEVPTKVVAEKYNIPVYQPLKIRKDYEFLKNIDFDLIITLAYGQIVPQGLLDLARLGAVNFHGSLLPKYRGAAPIQYSLINNEKVTGMTMMEMVKEMDAGRMWAKKEISIEESDNSTSLFKKMGVLAYELAKEYLPKYINGELKGIPQDESNVTFAPTIKKEEEKLSLSLPIEKLIGFIRALSDEPGGYLLFNNEKIKIFEAKKYSDEVIKPLGTILRMDKTGFLIQGKDGIISILSLQREGKKRMFYKDFINGNKELLGQVLK